MDEKTKTTQNQEFPATLEIPKVVCDKRCRICNSIYLQEIHSLKNSGKKLQEIMDVMQKKRGFSVSRSSLCRHFQNYAKHKRNISAQIIKDDLIDEATKQAVHTKKIVELIDMAFNEIKLRLDSGALRLDISDLEKLMKLRYQVLSGQDTDEKDLFAIFQKASNKYGLNLQQGVLFG